MAGNPPAFSPVGRLGMASQAERRNFLRRCLQSGRWQPVLSELFYIARRRFGRDRRPASSTTRIAAAPPPLDDAIHPVFTSRWEPAGVTAGLEALWADVDGQLAGRFRLAGGSVQLVDDATPAGLADPEDRHAYHRLYWAARYAQAAAWGHPEAARGLTQDWARWERNLRAQDHVGWHPYTCAERCASVVEMLHWIEIARLASLRSLVPALKRALWSAASQVAGRIEYRLGVHNHLLNDARGLYLASAALPEAPEAANWREQAFALWEQYFPQLVRPDGTFAEQSSHYHLLLCRTALEYVLAARHCDRRVADELAACLHAMFQLANDLLRPDGSLPRFGDNSPDHTVGDLWGLLAAAYAHGLLADAPRHPAVTPLTLYYCGSAPSLPQPAPPAPIKLYRDGGVLVLRRVVAGEVDVELTAFADPQPRIESHGDVGRGSFELWRAGAVLIRDPGNATYAAGPERAWFNSAQAQNCVTVDELAPVLPRDLQARVPDWYHAGRGEWTALGSGGATFASEAFRRLPSPVDARRSWWWAPDGRLVLADELLGSGEVTVEACLHLGDAPWRELDATHFDCRREQQPGAVHARMQLELAPGMQVNLEPAVFAPEYGVRCAGRVVRLHGKIRLPARWQVYWEFPTA